MKNTNYFGNDNFKDDETEDEFFLDKDIKDVRNPKIRDDLYKLIRKFPTADEYEVKLVYYQCMNYNYSVDILTLDGIIIII